MKDVSRQMAKGAAWMVLAKVTERGVGFISTLILARLLVPADFGLVAMGMSIYAGLEIMSAFSFELALIQNQHAERRHYDTAWTYNLIFAVGNALILTLLARPAAGFFAEPRVEAIMYCLAVVVFIGGFTNIGIVAFQKDLELHKDFRFGIIRKLAGFVVTVSLAFWWQTYWALLAGILTSKVTGVALSYWLHPYRPKLCLSAGHDLFHFSKWLLLNNILIFFNNRGIDFVVGKMIGAQALGLYTVAYEISNLPTTELVFPISRAVFPGYSKLAGDRRALRSAFVEVIALIALITVPAGIGIGVLAEPIVRVILGEKWMDAVPLVQVLAVFGVVRTLHGPPGSIYLALGKPRLVSFLQFLHIAIAVPMLIWLMSAYGIIGAPWAILVASAISMPTNYVWVMRELELSFARLAGALWRPLAAAALMFVIVMLLQHSWPASAVASHDLARLLCLVAAGAVAYALCILAFWRLARCPDGAERRLLTLLRARLSTKT